MISFVREKFVQNTMRIVREKIVILVSSHLRRRRIVGGQPHRRKCTILNVMRYDVANFRSCHCQSLRIKVVSVTTVV